MKKDILIYFDLITSLKTTKEAASFAAEIDTILQALFKSEKAGMNEVLASISEDSAQKIMQVFSKNNFDINNKDAVVDFLETLKKLIGKFKVIRLVLAFDPARKTIENIHNFVKDTLGIGYILDIEVSENLLGGAIVIFNGKYSDYSLKKMIDNAFADRNIVSKLMQ